MNLKLKKLTSALEKYRKTGKCPTCLKNAIHTGGALIICIKALRFYADDRNWKNDDWNVPSVIQPPEYGHPGRKARRVLWEIKSLIGLMEKRGQIKRAKSEGQR